MKQIRVVSKKFDGSPREAYGSHLVEETVDALTLYSEPGVTAWNFIRNAQEVAADGVIELFFTDRWFNVVHICEQVSGLNRSYINIATPATFRNDRLEWVDLDIDYRIHLDESVEQLDRDEFDRNIEHLNYPEDLVEQVHAACQEVETGLAERTFPFDYEEQVELYNRIKQTRLLDREES